MGRDDGVVVREIEPRRSVQYAAVGLNELDEFHLAQVLRALKHQMLEQMGEACSVARLNSKSDVVVNGDDGKGRTPFGREDDAKTVRQFVIRDRDINPCPRTLRTRGQPESDRQ